MYMKNISTRIITKWGTGFKQASLTIECAAVLPLFLFACITLLMFMDAVRMQTNETLILSNRARMLSSSAGLFSEGSGGSGQPDTDTEGSAGEGKSIWIDLRKTYRYEHPFPIFGLPKIRTPIRARVYPWIGSENGIRDSDGDGESADDDDIIYITDHESVYHTHADCSHLDLTIIKTSLSNVGNLRNADGKRYKRCRGFPRGYSGPVYVSARGTYYYPSTDYGALTRHVHISTKHDHEGLPLCQRCAAMDGAGG